MSAGHQLRPSGSWPERLPLDSLAPWQPGRLRGSGHREGAEPRSGSGAGGGLWAAGWRLGRRATLGHVEEPRSAGSPSPLSSQASPGSSGAELSRGQCASSARQGGRRSQTAAGRGLALAVSEEEAAKVRGTELSDYSFLGPGPERGGAGGTAAREPPAPQEPTAPPLSQGPTRGPQRAHEEGKGHFRLCISESTGGPWGSCFIWPIWCFSET